MIKTLSKSAVVATMVLLAACVTINVYFPAAAAEEAADRIIRDVYGDTPASEKTPDGKSETKQQGRPQQMGAAALGIFLDWVIPSVQAAANISIETPAIQTVKASMASRHKLLAPFYNSGAVGMTNDGLVKVRDLNAVRLPDRRKVQQLVADESRDRNALYKEIARANGHPEWEKEIRQTFARRWVDNAPVSWWYQKGSSWTQK